MDHDVASAAVPGGTDQPDHLRFRQFAEEQSALNADLLKRLAATQAELEGVSATLKAFKLRVMREIERRQGRERELVAALRQSEGVANAHAANWQAECSRADELAMHVAEAEQARSEAEMAKMDAERETAELRRVLENSRYIRLRRAIFRR